LSKPLCEKVPGIQLFKVRIAKKTLEDFEITAIPQWLRVLKR
jgi:hypothetical protein